MESLSFTLLTTVDVTGPGRATTITARRVRSVLAVLVLAASGRVPVEHLVGDVWGERPPASAGKNLQLYVHRIRRALDVICPGASHRLCRVADGYCLRAAPGEVDLFRVENRVRQAERAIGRGALTEGAALLDLALSEWSEHPLGGVNASPGLRAVAEQLRERRLTLLERRCELDLAMDRNAVAADRLRPLVAGNPLRETAHALLITALGRMGQRAQAAEVFHRLRRGLDHELAMQPGPAVRAAYQELIFG